MSPDGERDGLDEEEGGRSSQSSCGRPAIPFAEQRARTKRRASRDLSRSYDTSKLVLAAAQKSRSEGQTDLHHVLKQAVASPTRPTKMWRALKEAAGRSRPECTSPDAHWL